MTGAAGDGDADSGGEGGETAVSLFVLDPSNSPSFEMSKEDTIPSVHILSNRGGILLERIIVVEFIVVLLFPLNCKVCVVQRFRYSFEVYCTLW